MQLDQSIQNAADAIRGLNEQIRGLKDRLGRYASRIRNLRLSNQNLRLELENAELRHASEVAGLRAYIRDLEGRGNSPQYSQLYHQYAQMQQNQNLYASQQASQEQLAQLQYRQYQNLYDQGILGSIPDRQLGSVLRDCTCVPGRQGLLYDHL